MNDNIVLGTVTLVDNQNCKLTLNIDRRENMMIRLHYVFPPVQAIFSDFVPWWLVRYLAAKGLRSIQALNATDTASRVALHYASKRSITIEK